MLSWVAFAQPPRVVGRVGDRDPFAASHNQPLVFLTSNTLICQAA